MGRHIYLGLLKARSSSGSAWMRTNVSAARSTSACSAGMMAGPADADAAAAVSLAAPLVAAAAPEESRPTYAVDAAGPEAMLREERMW